MKREIDLDWAIALGLQALSHIVSDPALYEEFFDRTGLSPSELRPPRIEQRDFLAGVLDFILSDDNRLLDFCVSAEISPADPVRALRLLAGGTEAF